MGKEVTPKVISRKSSRMALVVHPDMGILSGFQSALTDKGFVTIVARDLPTALLAITQHYFNVAIVSSYLGEEGDGWPLAGVIHLVFPHAYVGVISLTEPDVLTLQAAINNGVREVYLQTAPAADIVDTILAQMEKPTASHTTAKATVQ